MNKPNEKALGDFFGGVANHQRKKKSLEELRAAEEAAREAVAQAERAAREAEEEKELKAVFPQYYESVEPIIRALEQVPARNGNEFFTRVDLNPKGWDCNTNVHGPEIGLWIFYTRRANDNDDKEVLPPIEQTAICEKGTTWDDGERVDLYMNDLPCFRVRSKPQTDGSMKITAEHVTTEYVCTGRKTGGSGSYRSGKDGNVYREHEIVAERQEFTNIRDLAGAIGAWVSDTVPERLDDVRAILSGANPVALQEKMTVSKPITFRKKTP